MAKLIVIGAGMGGLSAAIRLRHAGHRVTIVEKEPRTGGKVNILEADGFRFDMGPTILTMPGVIRRLFEDVGRDLRDYVEFCSFEPIYRAQFRDGAVFTMWPDEERTLAEIEALSPRDVDNYRRFMRHGQKLWTQIEKHFFNRVFQGWTDLLDWPLIKAGMQMDALRSMYRAVDSQFHDPRIKQLFMFQAIYVGAGPRQAPASYTVIPYLETAEGVWFPKGGIYGLVEGVTRLAEELGIEIRLNSRVARIELDGRRTVGVRLAAGEYLPADAIIANSDLVYTYRELVPRSARRKYTNDRLDKLEPSSSAFILYLGVKRTYPHLVHHNIFFSDDYDAEMRQIFEIKRPSAEPSWYINAPTRTDPNLAPFDHEALYALIVTPYSRAGTNWKEWAERYREFLLDRMATQAAMPDIREHIVFEDNFTPEDFALRYNANAGSIFGLSAKMSQTAFFRPPNRSEDVAGLYFVGGSTQPGGGVPIVMISGQLVAEMVNRDFPLKHA